jgi:hypothetical protein
MMLRSARLRVEEAPLRVLRAFLPERVWSHQSKRCPGYSDLWQMDVYVCFGENLKAHGKGWWACVNWGRAGLPTLSVWRRAGVKI